MRLIDTVGPKCRLRCDIYLYTRGGHARVRALRAASLHLEEKPLKDPRVGTLGSKTQPRSFPITSRIRGKAAPAPGD